MSWTEEKVNKLKELWGKGNTASQIAEIIGGISRNAVIGKAHRLNLSAKIKTRTATSNKNFEDSLEEKSLKTILLGFNPKLIETQLQIISNIKNQVKDNFILEKITDSDGFIAINDKSSPEIIKDKFQMSKKSFKKALGGLYKQKLITIKDDGIHLNHK